MSYNSEAVLQLRIVANGLDELTTALSKIDRDGSVAQKTLDALERTTARASKTAGSAADTAEAAAKGFSAESKAANDTAASIDRVAASSKGGVSSITSLQIALEKMRVQQAKNAATSASAAAAQADASTSALGDFKSSTVTSNVGDIDQSQARISAATAAAALQAETAEMGSLAVAERVASEASATLAAAQQKVASLGELTAANSATQAEAYRELAVATEQATASQAALAAAEKATSTGAGSLASMRNALNDSSGALTGFGAAMLALPVTSAIVSASYQRDFANVTRSLIGSKYNADDLKQSFVDLSEQIPTSFKGITEIASTGAQLGISAGGLTSYTKVVAELAATTNLSADAAGTMLAKFHAIAGVKTSDFSKLASAVLDVGVHTAATESQISKTATQIVGIGKEAGFTTPQIIGLSGAIASVSASGPELARGTVTRFVNDISKAVQNGGPALDAYAKTAGLTGAQVQAAFGTDKFSGTFQKFITGLNNVQKSGGDATAVLNQIGITSVRDVPLLLNLANGHEVLAEAMSKANEGWNNQALLQEHFDKINDTLISKVKELGNSFGALFNDMGSMSAGPIADVVSGLTSIVQWMDSLSKTSQGQTFLSWGLGLMTIVGVSALVFAGLAKLASGFTAITGAYTALTGRLSAYRAEQAAANAVAAEGAASTEGLAAGYITEGAAATEASVGVRLLGAAMKAASIVGLALVAAETAALLGNMENQWSQAADGITLSQGKVNKAAADGGKALDNSGLFKSVSLNGFWTTDLPKAAQNLQGFGQLAAKVHNSILGFGQQNLNPFGATDSTGITEKAQQLDTAFAQLAKTSAGTKTAAAEFAQLAKGWEAGGGTLSQLTKLFPKYSAEIAASTKAADSYNGSIVKQTSALKSVNEAFQANSGMTQKQFTAYSTSVQKSIAPLTDFNNVVTTVQSNLEAQAETLAQQNGTKSTDYYDGMSVSLQQMTDQYKNNTVIANTWLANIQQVAATYGTSVANQFVQAGYTATNGSILQQLVNAAPAQGQAYVNAMTAANAAAYTAMGTALITAGGLQTSKSGEIGTAMATKMGAMLQAGFSPADIMKANNLQFDKNPGTPKVDTGPAQSKLDGFKNANKNFNVPGWAQVSTSQAQAQFDAFMRTNAGKSLTVVVNTLDSVSKTLNSATKPAGATGGYFTGSSFKYSTGGAVFGAGTGTSDDVPAWLSNGEYVIKASSVRTLGRSYLDEINKYGSAAIHRATGGPVSQHFSPVGRYAEGGQIQAASPASPIMQLSPYDRQLLVDIRENIGVNLDGRVLANSNSAYNADSAARVRN